MNDPSSIPSEWWLPLILLAWGSLFLMIMWDRRKNRRQIKVFRDGTWEPIDVEALKIQGRPSNHRPVSQFFDQTDYDEHSEPAISGNVTKEN